MAEIHEAIAGICVAIQHLVVSYDAIRDPGSLDCLIYQVGKLLRILVVVAYCSNHVLEAIGRSLTLLEELQGSSSLTGFEQGYVLELIFGNRRGRPRLNITQEQIEYLLAIGFSCPKIADVIGVNLSTIRRRMSEYGLSVRVLYSTVSDEELDNNSQEDKKRFS